jgi:outer membrane protein assembly factor BamB
MSAPEAAPVVKRSRWRYWVLAVVIALALAGITALWAVPSEDWERANRVAFTLMIVQLTVVLLALWLLILSGLRWWQRIVLLLVFASIPFAAIRNVHFTGDMVPLLDFRWQPTQDEILEGSRQARTQAAGSAIQLGDARSAEFAEYRGRNREGVIHGLALAPNWRDDPPRLVWKKPIGGGYAAFAISGNLAVTIEQRRDEEAIVAYDTATGNERWVHAYPAFFKETLGGDGPRATPTIAGGDVYALGATGILNCLEAATGHVKWTVDILEDNDNVIWGMSGSPLVYDKLVVVNPGAQRESAKGSALVAYDRASGQPVWQSGTTRAGYSSPMLAQLAGHRQVILFDGEQVGGYDAANGKLLWSYPWEKTLNGINVAQPIVLDGDRVFISSGYDIGCTMLKITESKGEWSVEDLWNPKNDHPTNKKLRAKFSNPIAYKGYIYGLDDGILVCLDEKTGTRKWKEGRFGHGQMLRSDDKLLVLSESGKLALVEATPVGFRDLGSIAVLKGEKTWNNPAVADGKVFVRNHLEMACYDLRRAE